MEESKIISGLKFERYEVDEVSFNRNQKLPEGIDTWEIDFDVGAMVKTNEEKNKMKVNLQVVIFKKTKNPPFTMKVDIAGYFGTMENIDIEKKYKANAIAILYPYLRAIVSTYTASANISPIILPAINVNAMLKEKEKNK